MHININATYDNKVFVYWTDKESSGTLTLSAEEAEAIGAVGTMARTRRENTVQDTVDDDDEDFEPELKDMPVGHSGWTVPWALVSDNNKQAYLRLSFTHQSEPGGTVQMLVERLGENRWRVFLPDGEKIRGTYDPNDEWSVSYNVDILKYGDSR